MLPADFIDAQIGGKDADLWARRLEVPSQERATWLALRGDEVVGFASCGEARHRLEGLEAEIYALYVLQAEQRRGAGRELVRASARHFVRLGHFGFYLWVLKANRARLFYEALGGREIGARSERLGLHSFAEVAYGWHDLTGLVGGGEAVG